MSFAFGTMLAAAAASAVAMATPEAAVTTIFAPYAQQSDGKPAWDRPVYSRDLARLIARWRDVTPEDEPDELADGDWLCQCQDWDQGAFRVTIKSSRPVGANLADLEIALDLGGGVQRRARLLLRRQSSQWLIDNLFAEDFPQGLKHALRETIASDTRNR